MPLLTELLDLPACPLIAIVGAGGKTTTMYTLASELAQKGKRVITTTTTHIFFPKPGETDTLIVSAETPRLMKMISAAWERHQRITVASTVIGAGKLAGLHPDLPYELLRKSGADAVIVEADGARHKMIKAPADHEPVIPSQTNVVLLLLSAEAIGKPLSGDVAHRPERMAAIAGIALGDTLTPQIVSRLLLSEHGGMKHIPMTSKVYVLATHVLPENMELVREMASLVRMSTRVVSVFCSAEPEKWLVIWNRRTS